MGRIIKIFKWLAITLVVIIGLDAVLVMGFAIKSSNYKKADAIIIMGAAINSPALYNRSIQALKLYEEDFSPVMVLSGGRISDKDISEATYMQRVIQSKSTKPLNLILDEDARNTFENISNSKTRVPNAKSIIIITDKFHLARSVIMAKSVGFKNVFWHAPNGEYYPRGELMYYYLREMVAMLAYTPKFMLQIYE